MAAGILIIAYGMHQMTNNKKVTAPEITEAPREAPQPAGIIIAAHPIARGKAITTDDLRTIQSPGTHPLGAETSAASVIGRYAVTDIPAESTVLSAQISTDPTAAGLAVMVPVGYRAIEMRTNDEIAVGNFLRAGDHVDIELVLRENVLPKQSEAQEAADGNPSESRTLLQDVRVLAIGGTLGNPVAASAADNAAARKADPVLAVTLAMTPDQITQFMLAKNLGTLHLALRNPADIQTIAVGAATLPDIRGPTPPGAAAIAQGDRPIELIVGNKMHHIFSSNPSAKQ
jgi:pilus assembly protein CpaB